MTPYNNTTVLLYIFMTYKLTSKHYLITPTVSFGFIKEYCNEL